MWLRRSRKQMLLRAQKQLNKERNLGSIKYCVNGNCVHVGKKFFHLVTCSQPSTSVYTNEPFCLEGLL